MGMIPTSEPSIGNIVGCFVTPGTEVNTPTVAQGYKKITTIGLGFYDVMLGVYGANTVQPTSRFASSNVAIGVGDAVNVRMQLLTSGFALIEEAYFSGFVWDPVGYLTGMFRELQVTVSTLGSDLSTVVTDIATIRAAVQRTFPPNS